MKSRLYCAFPLGGGAERSEAVRGPDPTRAVGATSPEGRWSNKKSPGHAAGALPRTDSYIMSGDMPPGIPASFFSGISVTTASVVSTMAAIEAAF
jgi:hypothetical protein